VSGTEAVMFLNGLVTNDMKTLAVDTWMPAVFPSVQGRLLASVRIIHRSDGFLIDTEAATRETVLKLLDRFTMAGDFRVTDLTAETSMISLQGRKASETIGATLGEHAAILERQKVLNAQLDGDSKVDLIRASHTTEDGFDLFVETKETESVIAKLRAAGASDIGATTFETLRIEAGLPRYGIDMDETNVVTETNLDDAVSFTKGCYIGQEIIARIKYRGHVAKKLTGVILEHDRAVEKGEKIFCRDDKEIGRVTSSTFSPFVGRMIAMGYIKYDYLEPGTKVKIGANSGEVVQLPFVRGSWYEI